jgi:competence protein ComEA
MVDGYNGRFDLRNPRHIRIVFVLIAVAGIVTLTAVHYLGDSGSAGAGDVIAAGGAEGASGDVLSGADGKGASGDVVSGADGNGHAAVPPEVNVDGSQGEVSVGATPAAVAEPDSVFVDVSGAVNSPDVYELRAGSRVNEAIIAAGGIAADADIRYINRAAVLNDGDRLYIPTRKEIDSGKPIPASAGLVAGAPSAAPDAATDGASGSSPDTGGSGTAAGAKININTSDSAALQTLNGVGPATAQKIIDYRDAHGAFAKIEDIKKVSGIGDKTFEKLKEYITV